MGLMTSIVVMVALGVDYVQAHGYICNPQPTWRKKKNSEYVVQIEPQWKGDWDTARGDERLLAMFKKLSATNNYKNIRTLVEGNPVYGEECGYTDPKGKAVDPPTNNSAIFSRPIVHAGPCEIWLDDKLAFSSDDCQSHSGPSKVIFQPVDYSLCPVAGCRLKFYWLAMQRLKSTVWQLYTDCINLTGPPKGASSKKPNEDVSQTEVSMDSSGKTQSDGKTDDTSTKKSDKDTSKTPSPSESDGKNDNASTKKSDKDTSKTPSPLPETPAPSPEMSPAPSSKCKGRRRRLDPQ